MGTLIFDIETIGEKWDDLDDTSKEVLSRWTDRTAKNDAERESMLRDVRESLGFSPLTGRIVAIGLYDLERQQGAVYYTGDGKTEDSFHESYVLKECTEAEMLEDFWEGARSYDTFVTYNGRSFDVPFLLHRSVAHRIKPSVDLMEGRYFSQQKSVRHVDLQDQLTFYGAMHRRPSLHLFCRAFGIESPKASGVSGDNVAELFLKKKFRDIAVYNAEDVRATTELYELWKEYLAPTDFLNSDLEW